MLLRWPAFLTASMVDIWLKHLIYICIICSHSTAFFILLCSQNQTLNCVILFRVFNGDIGNEDIIRAINTGKKFTYLPYLATMNMQLLSRKEDFVIVNCLEARRKAQHFYYLALGLCEANLDEMLTELVIVKSNSDQKVMIKSRLKQ